MSSLLGRTSPQTADITLDTGSQSFNLHKFLLASRSPYFRKKLEEQFDTSTWKLASTIPIEAFQIAVRYIYLGDVPKDLVPPGSLISEEEIAKGLDKISKQLEIEQLWEAILVSSDRRLARQRYQDEVERALKQIGQFFQDNVLGHKMVVAQNRVDEVRWNHDNFIFADILLRADEPSDEEHDVPEPVASAANERNGIGIPIGPSATATTNGADKKSKKTVLYPAHKAMLIRSEYFDKMFSSDFIESQRSEHLRIIKVDCSPAVLELVLNFLYTENVTCPLEHSLELLYAADMLFLDNLKSKAAVAISTLGSGTNNVLIDRTHTNTTDGCNGEQGVVEMEPINIYDVIHAAWELRVQRLEEFAARYLANRLEDYIDEVDFHELIRESAARIKKREETDTIELLDDIRYYLSERFRLRFEDAGLEEMMDAEGEINAEVAAAVAASAEHSLTPAPAEKSMDAHSTEENGVQAEDGAVRTLDGETAEDEFASDAINYQILLGKIDSMLDSLNLGA